MLEQFSPGATRYLLKGLSDEECEEWDNIPIPPLRSPHMNLGLQLGSQQATTDTLLMSDKNKDGIAFEGNETALLRTLKSERWEKFLLFNRKEEGQADVEDLKQELWKRVMDLESPFDVAWARQRYKRGTH